jgi:phosphatidylinositol alpha-1,6-mannosyltransferase
MSQSPPQKHARIVVCALETYSRIGGIQNFNHRVFQNLAGRTLARDEIPPLVLVQGDSNASIPSIKGIEIKTPRNRIWFILEALWAILTQADLLIICHINLLPLAFLVRHLRPNMPILLFVHGFEAWNNPRLRSKLWYETWFARSLTRIASVSAFTADTMAREFDIPRTKFGILPNAVDQLTVLPGLNGRERATILTVTRLSLGDRDKNVGQMIRAVAKLKRMLPEEKTVKYEIVGDGALRPELEALAKDLGVGDIVRFLGCVDDAELHASYARATVFAMPSSKEGFGIVYLEAWQHKLPVICSSQGASSEIVSDSVDGFVVDPADIALLANRLHLLLTQPNLAKSMGESGCRKVAASYLNPAFYSNLDRLVDDLIENEKRV